jgi:hypothetical protein
VHLARLLKNDQITFTVVPKYGILVKMPRIQSLAGKVARRRNCGKIQPRLFHRPTVLRNPAKDAGFTHFTSHDGGSAGSPTKFKPAKIAGLVGFFGRAGKTR